MPHFIIDCSQPIIQLKDPAEIMKLVHDTAKETGLFKPGDIKVRINPFIYYNVDNSTTDFLHVFAYIMEGRNTEQKKNLSYQITSRLKIMFPDVPVISINISDFEKATYCNRSMV